MSLYGDYISERENKFILEDERGFATYYFIDNSVYIEDIYTGKDHRHKHVAADFADQIALIAKGKGIDKMLGSIVPSANHSTESLKVLLAYGFKLESCTNNFIIMSKGI